MEISAGYEADIAAAGESDGPRPLGPAQYQYQYQYTVNTGHNNIEQYTQFGSKNSIWTETTNEKFRQI